MTAAAMLLAYLISLPLGLYRVACARRRRAAGRALRHSRHTRSDARNLLRDLCWRRSGRRHDRDGDFIRSGGENLRRSVSHAQAGPLEALRATGASRLQVAIFGLLPLKLRDLLTYGSYEFESAIRASVIVGAVGGGGLGTAAVGTLSAFDFQRTSTILLVLVLMVAVIDQLTVRLPCNALSLLIQSPLAGLCLVALPAGSCFARPCVAHGRGDVSRPRFRPTPGSRCLISSLRPQRWRCSARC